MIIIQLYKIAKNYEAAHLKWVNFMLCKLHLNKAVKKYKRDNNFQEKS